MIEAQKKRSIQDSPTILIIDDDPGTCETLTYILKGKEYLPSSFSNGKDAIKAVQDGFVNLALIDLKLPDMPGIDVLAKIKELSPDTESVIITAYASLDTAVQAMHDAAFSYVTKPIDMEYLLVIIAKALEKQKLQIEHKQLQAQLIQAQKMEAIGTLAGGIAHDFNNILAVIQGNAQLISMDLDPVNPHYELVKEIENRVKAGANLTKQLLGFARGGTYEVRPIELNTVVRESSTTFGRAKKEITIHRKLQEDLPPIEADTGQIEQVLMNLYVNTAYAMPSGGDLYLETRVVANKDTQDKPFSVEPGNHVLLSVADTGVGMDKETRERIFDPFFTTRKMGRGTGLGLASVYGIIKAHKGYIEVESEKGRGTTFKIYFPVSEKEVAKPAKIADKVIKGTETILLVDDEAPVLKVGARVLSTLGYTVLEAKSGQEAVDIYKTNKNKIDLVILDMIMPDMGGGKVYDLLKGINPDIKVLLCSGYSIDGRSTEILEHGCNGFIQKPFDVKNLSGIIREILEEGKT